MSFKSIFSTSILVAGCLYHASVGASITLNPIGTYASGIFDEGAAQIVAFDSATKRLFVTNADENTLDVLDVLNLPDPSEALQIDLSPYCGGVNSVAAHKGLLAVACEADPKQDPGTVVFLEVKVVDDEVIVTDISKVTVGALPDMVTFTPNGKYVLVANEGEPDDDYKVDPEGSVSIIEVSGYPSSIAQKDVRTVTFSHLNPLKRLLQLAQIRIFGPDATVAQDLEPEYIAVSADSRTAYVTLQENNAMAIIDVEGAHLKWIKSFLYKWHILPGKGFDGSDKDGEFNIQNWPVAGMYQPDAIASYEVKGKTYVVTANEGDSRDYDGFSEEADVADLELSDSIIHRFPNIWEDENLGRLGSTNAPPFGKRNGETHQLFSFGARSFSIWNHLGKKVYDSGEDFEQITAAAFPHYFNANNDNNDFDNRSDNKGPEPEGVVVGKIDKRFYAFIGLERIGGIMVYDVTNPYAAKFVDYVNNRDFTQDVKTPEAGDLGPEGLAFIPASDSPNDHPLLVVANEVSGTTTVYEIVETK